ncbi:MAG: YqhA family protein [Roseiflexaceae bacterium]|nr:YqhA family protein [Roseiflexaceae bacterium]
MFARIISSSRFLIIIAVLGSFLGATSLLIYGAYETFTVVASVFGNIREIKGKQLLLEVIELIDLFLLSTVFYVIAVGLYELFIQDNLPLPKWLEFHTLDDLKDKLVGMIIVALAVLFLGQIVSWDGQRDLLGYGVAVALVIAALTYFLSQKSSKTPKYPDKMT